MNNSVYKYTSFGLGLFPCCCSLSSSVRSMICTHTHTHTVFSVLTMPIDLYSLCVLLKYLLYDLKLTFVFSSVFLLSLKVRACGTCMAESHVIAHNCVCYVTPIVH